VFVDAIAVADEEGDPSSRVTTRVAAIDVLVQLGRHADADALSSVAEDVAAVAGDHFVIASLLAQRGDVYTMVGREAEARALYHRAAAEFALADRRRERCEALFNAIAVGPFDPDLRATAAEGQAEATALGDEELQAVSTFVAALFEEHAGNLHLAMPGYIDAFDQMRQLRSPWTERAGVRIARVLRVGHPEWSKFPTASGGRSAGVARQPPPPTSTVFLSWRFDARVLPWSGWRVPGEGGRSGWYLWTGIDQPDDENRLGDVFVERSMRSAVEDLPELRGYLDLPADWCFQIAPSHEDVWQPEDIG